MASQTKRIGPPICFISKQPFSSSPSIDPSDGGDVISTAVSILRSHRSRSRWGYLKTLFHPAGFTPAEASGILLGLRNSPRVALRFFIWSHRRRLCRHDASSFAAAAHVLARSRHRAAALSLLRSAVRLPDDDCGGDRPPEIFAALARTYRAFDSAPFVFDLLIEAYLQSKKLDPAVQISRSLLSRGIHPTIGTSNSLIRSVSQSRGSDAGVAIYREIFARVGVRVSPDVQTFNILLLAFYQDGRSDAVEEIREDMERFSCEFNVFTYGILMAEFCDKGRILEAKKLWEDMVDKRIKPDLICFNTMIGGYCEAEEMDKAEELFREMVVNEIEPSCSTFEHLISGHCKVGDVETALLLFDDMRRRGHKPEVSIVDKVIDGMCEMGRVTEGLEILREEMRIDEGFRPSRLSYELLVRGFCEKGKVEDALRLQAEMVGKGYEPDSKVYDMFIEGYKKQGDFEKAQRLKDEMLEMCAGKEGV